MRRFIHVISFLICFLMLGIHSFAAEVPTLYAGSAVLMDGESGRVLYGKKELDPMANASTTKVMTCILVLEECGLEECIYISSYSASMPKVNCGLRKGESYQVRDLLYSMMLESHNDSAAALAEHVGKNYVQDLSDRREDTFTEEESKKSLKAFSLLMNEKAREIGCRDTYFITPNGLDATETIVAEDGGVQNLEHHTTARDLALIMAYCVLKSPKKEAFLKISGTKTHSFSENGRNVFCQNHNAFMTMMDGVLGGKTGFTGKAGYCYVGALERDGRVFVVSLLACGWPNNRNYKWTDMRKLMDYALSRYHRIDLVKDEVLFREDQLPAVLVKHGQGKEIGSEAFVKCSVLTRRDGLEPEPKGVLLADDEKIDVHIQMEREMQAPVKEGEVLGEILYSIGEESIYKEPIVSAVTVLRIDYAWCVKIVLNEFLKGF